MGKIHASGCWYFVRYIYQTGECMLVYPLLYISDNNSVVLNTTMSSSVLQKKHCVVSYHKIRETIAAGIVRFSHIPSDMNYADILTKPLGPNVFMDLVKPLLFRNPPKE